jgi:hypothetical protein
MNVEAYVGVQGAGYMQRKLVASVSMTHTITMDPQLRAVRIQEKAGPIDTDYTLIIGASSVKNEVMKKVFLDRSNMRPLHSPLRLYMTSFLCWWLVRFRAYWSGDKLVVHRVLESGEYELVLTRQLEGSKTIVLSQLHR